MAIRKVKDEIIDKEEIWYCDNGHDETSLDENLPAGSIVEILTPQGLIVKMKDSNGSWYKI